MNVRYAAPLRAISLALPALLLSACSLMNGSTKPVAPAEPPPPPPVPEPVATHLYEIDPEHEDVIGLIQVVKAGKEDTLTDIARRPVWMYVSASGVLVYFMLYNIHR